MQQVQNNKQIQAMNEARQDKTNWMDLGIRKFKKIIDRKYREFSQAHGGMVNKQTTNQKFSFPVT